MDMKSLKIVFLVVTVSVVLMTTGCTSGPKVTDESDWEKRVCINSRIVRNFDALGDNYVYVREGSDKHFLLITRFRCRDLGNAYSLAISSTTSRVCAGGFSKIIYRDLMDEQEVQSCTIETIVRVDDKEHARRIAQGQTGTPQEQGTWSELPSDPPTDAPSDPPTEVPDPE